MTSSTLQREAVKQRLSLQTSVRRHLLWATYSPLLHSSSDLLVSYNFTSGIRLIASPQAATKRKLSTQQLKTLKWVWISEASNLFVSLLWRVNRTFFISIKVTKDGCTEKRSAPGRLYTNKRRWWLTLAHATLKKMFLICAELEVEGTLLKACSFLLKRPQLHIFLVLCLQEMQPEVH